MMHPSWTAQGEDPDVEIREQDSGEHVVLSSGRPVGLVWLNGGGDWTAQLRGSLDVESGYRSSIDAARALAEKIRPDLAAARLRRAMRDPSKPPFEGAVPLRCCECTTFLVWCNPPAPPVPTACPDHAGPGRLVCLAET